MGFFLYSRQQKHSTNIQSKYVKNISFPRRKFIIDRNENMLLNSDRNKSSIYKDENLTSISTQIDVKINNEEGNKLSLNGLLGKDVELNN
jgi:hypothetical protein